jgi:hypothetical protein
VHGLPRVTSLGAINSSTTYSPRLLPYRVSKGLCHSISNWFKVGLRCLVNAYSSHSIHTLGRGDGSSPQSQLWAASGLVPKMQGDGSTTVPGESMEVANVELWSSRGLVPNYVVSVGFRRSSIGSRQWRWTFSSYAKSSYTGPKDRLKKASDSDFEYSSNIQLRLKRCFFTDV